MWRSSKNTWDLEPVRPVFFLPMVLGKLLKPQMSISLHVNVAHNTYFIAKDELNFLWKILLHYFIFIGMDSGGIKNGNISSHEPTLIWSKNDALSTQG